MTLNSGLCVFTKVERTTKVTTVRPNFLKLLQPLQLLTGKVARINFSTSESLHDKKIQFQIESKSN
jgi:hypothetical protein